MKASTEYSEKQKVDTLWPLALMALTLMVNWYVYFRQGFTDISYFYVSFGTVALICIFLLTLKLYTTIDNQGISYRFFLSTFRGKK